nr:PC4/YdbC family ssDNA-binding protein [Paradesulfitobacterium ferrireducens]
MPDIKYEIKETLGVLSEGSKGWSKEVNLISWNDREPKYDIREWSPDHSKMGKGVTLSKQGIEGIKRTTVRYRSLRMKEI